MTAKLDNHSVEWVQIGSDHAGQRIDNFLLTRLRGVPRSHVYRILRTGEVRRNGGRVKAQDRLVEGDRLRIPPLKLLSTPQAADLPLHHLRERIESRILFEDDLLLVLNKPSGMAVHGGSGLSFGVIEALRQLRPQARFLELVHRLDRETSGCLLIAKKRSALRSLHDQFRGEDVDKRYVTLLAGPWNKRSWRVDAPLQKNVLQSGERMVRVAVDGKPSVTDFKRLQSLEGATLVEARPLTGRTHQIRVHARHMGFPVAGDTRYGEESENRRFRQLGLKRLFLHARETAFRHPVSGEPLHFQAPLDPELKCLLERIAP